MRRFGSLSFVFLLFCGACGSDDSPNPGPATSATSGSTGGGAGRDAGGGGTGGSTSIGAGGAPSGGAAGQGGASGGGAGAGQMDAGLDGNRPADASAPDSSASDAAHDAGDAQTACPAAPAVPCAATDLAGKLRCIPGVHVQPSMAAPPGYQRFDLTIDQPVDHANPTGAIFPQRIVLFHKSPTAPMILHTSGYGMFADLQEPTTTFGGNQISIEHRYFTPSIPATPVNWQWLTIEQSAADSHHIWESFKWLYTGKWANTGASKGGETAVYHRRFYPCDVDATVAYVAPLVLGLDDQRFVSVQQNAGGPAYASCRTRLVDYVKACLNRRNELIPMMDASMYTRLGVDVGFEAAVSSVYWGFWQYQPPSMCNSVPAANASANALFAFLKSINVVDTAVDSGLSYFGPYFFQTANQLGAPHTWDDPWNSLLKHADIINGIDAWLPLGVTKPAFHPEAMIDIQNWVKTSGQRLMFVYGEFDPWTGGAYELGNAVDSFKFIAPGGNHGSQISSLSPADKDTALTALQRWLSAGPITTGAVPAPVMRYVPR